MTLRLALAALAIVTAALAYPWQTTLDWWVLGVGAAVLVVVFAWWRGLFVTTMIGRRLAMWRRNGSSPKLRATNAATVLLRVDGPSELRLPLALIASFVERFGVRSAQVRVTSRDQDGQRQTWVGVTVDATDNLAALQARSTDLPLYDTAEVVGRRLADQLRERGFAASLIDESDAPIVGRARERWTSVTDDRGAVSAYAVRIDGDTAERLVGLWTQSEEKWTALEFSGTTAHPTVSAVCAIRTPDPVKGAPLAGLAVLRGVQGRVLAALDPTSTRPLGVPVAALSPALLDGIGWTADVPVAATAPNPVLAEQTPL